MSKALSLSVVVCTKNRPQLALRLLRQLQRQTVKPQQIVVVEDVTEAQSLPVALLQKMFPKIRVSYQKTTNAYIGHLRNLGLKNSISDLIIFIDDDVLISSNLLQRFLLLHRLYPEALGFCGKIIPTSMDAFSLFSAHLFNREFSTAQKVMAVPFYGFSCISLCKKIITKEKMMFREDIDSGEDILFLLQYTRRGYQLLYSPHIRVFHDFLRGNGLVSFITRSYRYGKDLAKLHKLEPKYFKEVDDSLPKRKLYWYILPLFIFLKPFSQSFAFNSLYGMKASLLIPSYLHHLVYLMAIYLSHEGKALLKHRFVLHFGSR